MIDKGFSKRLETACDQNPHVPEYGRGRQTWVKEKMNVSHEAVSKWFTGMARPKPDKMRKLAKLLGVDEAWLSLGITPETQPRERRTRTAALNGGVNYFMGLVQLNGGHCAPPAENDPRADVVDFYGILRGVQLAFTICLATQTAKGEYKFIVPSDCEHLVVIGLVHLEHVKVDLLHMPFATIDRHKTRKGGYFEIHMEKQGTHYFTGRDEWQRVKSIDYF